MSLNTGKLIHAFHWESLPIDDHIVGRVVELANNDKAPTMNNGPVFEWRPGIPVTMNEDEDILTDAEDDASDDASLPPLDHGTYPSDSDDDDDAEDDDDDDEFFDLGEVNTPFADDDPPPDPLPENQGAALQNVDTDIDDTSTIGDTSTLNGDDGDDASYTPPTTPDNQGALQANQGAQPSENSGAHSRPRRSNAGSGVDRLEPSMHGKTHSTVHTQLLQLADKLSTDKPFEKHCYKLAGDVIFAQILRLTK